jgi:uncharacterized protein YaaN involved in tellurite resistance
MADEMETPKETNSIVTMQQYSKEIKRSPALPPLSDTDMARARELSRALIRTEDQLDDIVVFGSDAHNAVAQITRDMLRGVRVNAMDDVIHISDHALVQINALDLGDLTPAARRFLLVLHESTAAIKHRIEKFFRGYELVNSRLEYLVADILAKETEATKRYYADVELEKGTFDVMLDARIKLAAIRLFLNGDYGYEELDRRQKLVAEEQAAAGRENRSVDFVIVAAAERYAKYIERLEMKAASLSQAILSAYQTGVTIRMMGENENIIRQKLVEVRTELVPQWRTLIAIAYSAYQQRGIAAFVGRVQDAEGELRRKVADQLEMATNGVADMVTRQTFDPEAMIYYHDKLVKSLETLKTASMEARKIRSAAEAFTEEHIAKLGAAVAATSLRAPQD